MTLRRQKERVAMRRQIRKQTIKDMARKGRVAFRGKPYKRRSSEYVCGPCSAVAGYRVYHRHSSKQGRMDFLFDHSKAYTFPTVVADCCRSSALE